ncbi:hypothetical protein B484DRAFT_437834 [Ochromonadaceae sp. CCMP2298]|nr:hypothetical protein B484DRAFT_437834 [Ochromonadaceae sp. CCMP2298]
MYSAEERSVGVETKLVPVVTTPTSCSFAHPRRFYDPLAVALDDAFPGLLTITATKDPGTTGNFEIVIKNTGELIHSKTTRGQGRCEKQKEVDDVVAKIQAYMDSV